MSTQEQEGYAIEAFKLLNEGKYEELQRHLQLYPKVCSDSNNPTHKNVHQLFQVRFSCIF
jgi:hypothetical protein